MFTIKPSVRHSPTSEFLLYLHLVWWWYSLLLFFYGWRTGFEPGWPETDIHFFFFGWLGGTTLLPHHTPHPHPPTRVAAERYSFLLFLTASWNNPAPPNAPTRVRTGAARERKPKPYQPSLLPVYAYSLII